MEVILLTSKKLKIGIKSGSSFAKTPEISNG
jgi:hypothetical protein